MFDKTSALDFLAGKAEEVGYTSARFEHVVREYLDSLDSVWDEYAYTRSELWDWEEVWDAVAVAYDLPSASKRLRTLFTADDPYDDGCRGCW